MPKKILNETQLLYKLSVQEFSIPIFDENDIENELYWSVIADLISAILDLESYIQKIICDIRFQSEHELWMESMQISLKVFSEKNFFQVF